MQQFHETNSGFCRCDLSHRRDSERPLFGPPLNPQQHPPLHEEVRDLHQHHVVETSEPALAVAAYEQACALPAERLDNEGAPALEAERAAGLIDRDGQAESPMQLDRLADLAWPLPLWMDPVGVMHPTASQIFQPLVAVEPTALLPDLCKPGPDLLGRRIDHDGVRRLDRVVRSKFVASERLAYLVR